MRPFLSSDECISTSTYCTLWSTFASNATHSNVILVASAVREKKREHLSLSLSPSVPLNKTTLPPPTAVLRQERWLSNRFSFEYVHVITIALLDGHRSLSAMESVDPSRWRTFREDPPDDQLSKFTDVHSMPRTEREPTDEWKSRIKSPNEISQEEMYIRLQDWTAQDVHRWTSRRRCEISREENRIHAGTNRRLARRLSRKSNRSGHRDRLLCLLFSEWLSRRQTVENKIHRDLSAVLQERSSDEILWTSISHLRSRSFRIHGYDSISFSRSLKLKISFSLVRFRWIPPSCQSHLFKRSRTEDRTVLCHVRSRFERSNRRTWNALFPWGKSLSLTTRRWCFYSVHLVDLWIDGHWHKWSIAHR